MPSDDPKEVPSGSLQSGTASQVTTEPETIKPASETETGKVDPDLLPVEVPENVVKEWAAMTADEKADKLHGDLRALYERLKGVTNGAEYDG